MKAYVIKNKEGKYFSHSDDYGFDFDKSIDCAFIFAKRDDAEREKDFMLKYHIDDLDIIPITICEGDLEEENRVLKKAFDYAIFELDFAINHSQSTNSETIKRIDKLKNKILNKAKESERDERN